MTSRHPDQELIEKRLAVYEVAWKKCSVDDILSFMAEDVSISDFGVKLLNLDKGAARTFFTNMFASCDNLTLATRSVDGYKYFTTWEWEATFNYIKPLKEMASEEGLGPAMADGRLVRMMGVTLHWWNEDGKIVKEHDYSKTVDHK